MDEIRDRTYADGETVEMDDRTYIDCKFEWAVLHYSGGQYPRFENCTFRHIQWYFAGPALRTVQLLQMLANAKDGDKFLASVFQPGLVYDE